MTVGVVLMVSWVKLCRRAEISVKYCPNLFDASIVASFMLIESLHTYFHHAIWLPVKRVGPLNTRVANPPAGVENRSSEPSLREALSGSSSISSWSQVRPSLLKTLAWWRQKILSVRWNSPQQSRGIYPPRSPVRFLRCLWWSSWTVPRRCTGALSPNPCSGTLVCWASFMLLSLGTPRRM